MEKKNFPEPVEALTIILAVFAAIILSSLIFSAIFGMNINPPNIEKTLRYFFIFGGSLFLIVPLIYAMLRRYDLRTLFRLRPISLNIVGLSIVGGLSLSVLSDELDRLLSMVIPMPEWLLEQMRPLHVESPVDWLLVISGAVIIASISEEGLFRGFLQVTLEQKGDATRAVLLSAVTWTLIHMNPYWAIQIFVTGVVIGFLAWRSDSIFPAIIVHAINNLLAVLFLNLKLEGVLGWYLWKEHVAPWTLAVAAALLVWSIRVFTTFYRRD